MLVTILLFVIVIGLYCISNLVTAFGRLGMSGLNKALSSCPVLFQLYSKEIEAKSSYIFFSMIINITLCSSCSFIGSSNHFIISMDIIYFFSLMMIIFYHTFKIQNLFV
jgi:hypothetical protein